jgi:8-amino-7-oxononanoate synthase
MAQQTQPSDCFNNIEHEDDNWGHQLLKRGAEELGVIGLRDILEGRSNCHSLNYPEYHSLPSLLDQILDMDESKPKNGLEKTLRDRLDRRYVNSTLRKLTTAPQGAVDFSSNDFLSLSTSPALRSAFIDELTKSPDFTLGSGGSRLLDGNSPYATALEDEIAAFHNASAGLLFNSGFDANSGVFACIPQSGDIIVHDELIHASVHDGMRMSRAAKKIPFPHNCTEQLRKILNSLVEEDVMIGKGPKNVFIAVESVYSMDGDIAPLREIVDLVDEVLPYGNGHIIIDEAHGTGVIGPKGRGLVCELGLEDKVFARLHTFGKALASSGGQCLLNLSCRGRTDLIIAIVLCSPLVRSYLINYARPLIYTTFMPFPSLASIKASYTLLQNGTTEPVRNSSYTEVLQNCYEINPHTNAP